MQRRMTLQEVIDLEPCWLEEDREAGIARIKALFGGRKYATPQRILAADISSEDKLWLLLREPFFTDQQLALIACDFAAAVLPIYEAEVPGDTRPRDAIDTVRRYARGGVGSDEMMAAVEAAAEAAQAAQAAKVAWAAWAAAKAAAKAVRAAAEANRAAWAAWAATWANRAAGATEAAQADWDAACENQLRLLEKYI